MGIAAGPDDYRSYFYGLGKTSQDGRVRIRVKIKRYTRPGWADVIIYARKEVARDPGGCANIYEYGRKQMPYAFRVVA